MSIEADIIYRNRQQILADFITRFQARIPDVHVEEGSTVRITGEVLAELFEGVYLANQILRDNIFVQTANLVELRRHGEQYGLPVLPGTYAEGSVRFSGAGGVVIPSGSMVGVDIGQGDSLRFVTTAEVTIPNPGDPAAPVTTDSGVASNPLAGTYEYIITFVTAEGETAEETSGVSLPLVTTAARRIDLTSIPLGGPGTTARKIYRQRDGGGFKFVTTLANNTATTFQDTIAEGSLGAAPLIVSTAERVTTTARAEEIGEDWNVLAGTIRELMDVPDGVTDVYNVGVFIGGTDEEDMEHFRQRLLDFIRNPRTGSPSDLESWAESITGVDTATTFTNDNLGVATPGHATVRIAGPDGTVPSAAVVNEVLAFLQAEDIANITIHVATFTPVATNVTVDVTTTGTTTLAEVTPSVQDAIVEYINAVPVGGTVYVAGIIDAVFGLPGVATVSVTTPATDQTTTATQKRTPGTITVT